MRGIVLKESLVGGSLPLPFPAMVVRRYPHLLDRKVPVEVIEFTVAPARVAEVALQLARAIVPERFYAHLLDDTTMIVVFPRCVLQIARDDAAGAERAQQVGELFGIPRRQMRFLEMFTTDHPDAQPAPAGAEGSRP